MVYGEESVEAGRNLYLGPLVVNCKYVAMLILSSESPDVPTLTLIGIAAGVICSTVI